MRIAVAAVLLLALPASARPLALSLKWEELRTVVSHADFRDKVVVQTGPFSRDRIKGRLVSITDTSVVLRVRRHRTAIDRKEVHSIRMLPRQGLPWKWRTWAGVALVPLFLFGFTVGLATPGGIPEGRFWKLGRRTAQGWAAGLGLPAAVYWIALRADRTNGTVIIRLRQ